MKKITGVMLVLSLIFWSAGAHGENYKLLNQGVQRLSDGAVIPKDDGNTNYQNYKKWLTQGNIPEPEFTQAELADKAAKEKAISDAKTKTEKLKGDLSIIIASQEADPSKLKLIDLLDRIKLIETILNLR